MGWVSVEWDVDAIETGTTMSAADQFPASIHHDDLAAGLATMGVDRSILADLISVAIYPDQVTFIVRLRDADGQILVNGHEGVATMTIESPITYGKVAA